MEGRGGVRGVEKRVVSFDNLQQCVGSETFPTGQARGGRRRPWQGPHLGAHRLTSGCPSWLATQQRSPAFSEGALLCTCLPPPQAKAGRGAPSLSPPPPLSLSPYLRFSAPAASCFPPQADRHDDLLGHAAHESQENQPPRRDDCLNPPSTSQFATPPRAPPLVL